MDDPAIRAAVELAVRHDDHPGQCRLATNPMRAFCDLDEIAWVVTLNLVATAIATRRPVGWRAGSAGGASCSAPSAASRYARFCAGSPTAFPRSSFSPSDRVSSER